MKDQMTIDMPGIDETTITAIETEATRTVEMEIQAVTALREKYAPLARHSEGVRTSYHHRGNSNYSSESETFYMRDGKRVRAFLVIDDFSREHDDQNRGSLVGTRLYLTEHAQWLRLERTGSWSNWQGEGQGWSCGVDDEDYDNCGSTEVITDQDVIVNYSNLEEVVDGCSDALKALAENLPLRLVKIRERASLASQLLAALK